MSFRGSVNQMLEPTAAMPVGIALSLIPAALPEILDGLARVLRVQPSDRIGGDAALRKPQVTVGP